MIKVNYTIGNLIIFCFNDWIDDIWVIYEMVAMVCHVVWKGQIKNISITKKITNFIPTKYSIV